MIVLGIDSSCDETAAAVVRDGHECLSNVVASQMELHSRFGGVVPEVACRVHVENYPWVVEEALRRAGVTPEDLDGIAVTHRPGLVGALLVGVTVAKALSLAWDLPLVGVDHIAAHVHAAFLSEEGAPDFPSVALVVSGGHTSLFLCRSAHEHELVGATIDDAAGEAFDKVARLLDLGYPGGPAVERAARDGDPTRFPMPRTSPRRASLDFSFSGLKTAVLYGAYGQGAKPRETSPEDLLVPLADVAAGFQEAVVEVLVRKTLAAARRYRVGCIVAGGGVACNGPLRERLHREGEQAGLRVVIPERRYCTDNAAMVAVSGTFRLQAGERDGLDLDCHPRPVRAAR